MAINLLQAHGQLCYEPCLDSKTSTPYLRNTIMVKRSFRNPKTGNYDFDYIPIIARGNVAAYISETLHRLDYVYIVGRLFTTGNKSYVEVTEADIDKAKIDKEGE